MSIQLHRLFASKFRAVTTATVMQILAITLALLIPTQMFAAEQHVVNPGQMRSALNAAAQQRAKDLADVNKFFSDSRVREVLGKAKMDANQISQAAATLNDSELAQLAAKARGAQQQIYAGAELTRGQTSLIILAVAAFAVLAVLVVAFK